MKLSRFFVVLAACALLIPTADARTKKKKSKPPFKLIEAYNQRILPGIPHGVAKNNMHLVIIWQDKQMPGPFYWRGDNGWLICNTARAHRITGHSSNIPAGMDYTLEKIYPQDVHKGDTLMLDPVAGGKIPVPAEIPAEAKNTLFYKLGNSGWLPFVVSKIAQKQDIAAP